MASETIKYAGLKLQIDGAAEFQKTMSEVNSGLKLSQSELSKATAEYGKNSKNIEALTAQQKHLENSLSLNKDEQKALNEMIERASEKYGENSKELETLKTKLNESEAAEIRIKKALEDVSKELTTQQSGWTKLGENLTEQGKKLTEVGGKITDIGGTLTKGVTAPLMAAGAGLVAVGAQFDDAYDKIRIGTGATGDALNALTDDFKAVASIVPASFDDISTSIADYNTRLDLSGKELQELSEQTLNLCNITGGDLSGTIESTSKTFKAFNLTSEEYGSSLDYIFKVSQSTGIGVDRLQGNMAKFSPALKELGLGFTESATLMGVMDKAGVDVEASLGAMNKAVVNMAKNGVTDANEAIKILMDNIKNAPTDMEATQMAMETFGAKGGVGMATAIREGKLSYEELIQTLTESEETINGVANETYDWAESFTVLKNQLLIALEPLAGQLFDAVSSLVPLFQKAVEWVTSLVEKFTSLDESTQKNILVFAGIAAAVGPVVSAIGGVISVAGTLSTTFGGIATAVGAAGGLIPAIAGIAPVLLPIVGVIAGVVAASVLLYQNWDLVKEKAQALWEYLQPTFNEIKKFFTGWAETVAPIFTTLFDNIKKLAETVFNAIKDFWNKWGDTIKACFENLFNGIKIIVSTAFEAIKTVINTALNIISGIINVFTSVLKGDWQGAWDSIKSIFSNAWEGIKSVCGTLLNGILDLFKNSISGMISIGADIIGGLIEGLKSKADAVKNTVTSMISGFTDSIKNFFGISSPSKLMKQYFAWVGEGMVIGLNSQADNLINASKDISKNVTDSLQIDPTGLVISSKEALNSMQNALPEMKSNINHVTQAQTTQGSGKLPDVIITGNQFIVREESDIQKITKEVMRLMEQAVNHKSRMGGIALTR